MSGNINAHHLFFKVQFFDFTEGFHGLNTWLGHCRATGSTEKACLCALFFQLSFRRILDGLLYEADISVFRVDKLPSVKVGETIEGAGQSQAFKCFFVDGPLI
jgi:hypothetical protein